MSNPSQFKTHRSIFHALKWGKKKKVKPKFKILKPVKFSTLLEPFLFQLKPCEIISIGAKGTGNSRVLLPLSVRHRLQP